jgi:hypothetical protein
MEPIAAACPAHEHHELDGSPAAPFPGDAWGSPTRHPISIHRRNLQKQNNLARCGKIRTDTAPRVTQGVRLPRIFAPPHFWYDASMGQSTGRGAVISTIASLASLLAALTCCLPLGTLLLSAGSAGASLFSEKLRPWLLALSAAALVFAFVQTYFRGRCEFRHRRLRTCLLWFSATVLVGMLVMPRYVSSLMAGRLPSFSAASDLRDFDDRQFIREFDAALNQTRVVLLLSPT